MKSYPTIKLVIADSQDIFRQGLVQMLTGEPGINVAGTTSGSHELPSLLQEFHPDILLADAALPFHDGHNLIEFVQASFPAVNIIILSLQEEVEHVVEMLKAGIQGYLMKTAPPAEIIEAIHTVHNKQLYYSRTVSGKLLQLVGQGVLGPQTIIFSEKETAIIRLTCEDLSAKEIAARLKLSSRTVEAYRLRIMEKMNVKGTAGMVIYAIKHHICSLENIPRNITLPLS